MAASAIRSPQEVCQNFENTAVPSSGFSKGILYKVNDTVVLNLHDTDFGATAVNYYWIPKVLVDVVPITLGNLSDYGVGSKVYFDSSNNRVTAVSGGNTVCGIVTTAPANGATQVEIHLDGYQSIT